MAFLALACSDDEGLSAATFCERWASRACSEQTVAACQATGADACRASQQAFCDAQITRAFDDAQATACLDAVGRAYEDADLTAEELIEVVRLGGDCARVQAGDAAEGGGCAQTAECDAPAGLECIFKGDESSGRCQLPVAVAPGFDCTAPEARCGDGFYCDGQNCIAGKTSGAACVATRQCATGTYCGGAGACAPRLELDAACSTDDQCASGFCYDVGAGEPTCASLVRLGRSDPLCERLR